MTEKFSIDWNIDSYYDDTEPQEHWELRQAFMEIHKNKFPEDYLVALSKAFTNIEFLGCIYPTSLMARISELSKDIAKTYRALKGERLQRTFITASHAASQRRTERWSSTKHRSRS